MAALVTKAKKPLGFEPAAEAIATIPNNARPITKCMSTPSTPPYFGRACRPTVLGSFRPTGPGGGGSCFPTRAEPWESVDPHSTLLPSSSPVVVLLWPEDLVGTVVRVYANLEGLREDPLYMAVVPPSRRTVFSGIFADEVVPSAVVGGLLTIGDTDGQRCQIFQLSWGEPGTTVQCSVPESMEFLFVGASAVITFQSDGTPVADGPASLKVRTLKCRPAKARSYGDGSKVLPWQWRVVCYVQNETTEEEAASPAQEALTAAILAA